jgi:hypothetical protein
MAIRDSAGLLRKTLRVNAAASGASALLFLVLAPRLAAPFGVPPAALWVFGAALLGFAAWVAQVARPRTTSARAATLVLAADVAYVVASGVVLLGLPNLMSNTGRLAFAVMADAVALLAIAEYVGLRRLNRVGAVAAA